MLLWRLTPKTHSAKPLSGEGSRRHGGRWNHAGTAVVYSSATLSLAVLEYLVNLDVSHLPTDLVSIELNVPDNLSRKEISANDLPPTWRDYPGPEDLKDIGSAWIKTGADPLLVVPSAVIPREFNFVINPDHPAAVGIKTVKIEPFTLDPRLFSSRKAKGGNVTKIR